MILIEPVTIEELVYKGYLSVLQVLQLKETESD